MNGPLFEFPFLLLFPTDFKTNPYYSLYLGLDMRKIGPEARSYGLCDTILDSSAHEDGS